MSRAEKFILENTNDGSSDIIGWCDNGLPIYQPWLTPDEARRAVEIAREEMIEKACKWLKDYKSPLEELGLHTFIDDGFINDLRKAMQDE